MRSLDQDYVASEWRLFIDLNKRRLKVVLLHNGKEKALILMVYSTKSKETHHLMKDLLVCIGYEEHKWHICRDLKVASLLLGLQLGYTKCMCFLCLWNAGQVGSTAPSQIGQAASVLNP